MGDVFGFLNILVIQAALYGSTDISHIQSDEQFPEILSFT